MKKIVSVAFASAAALALAGCGSADDASEDAMADNVEMPADEVMAGVDDPVVDDAAADAQMDANEATATQAADEATATVADVEAATQAAEEGM
jgi:hypothetical protein